MSDKESGKGDKNTLSNQPQKIEEDYDSTYQAIIKFYDFAEELVDNVQEVEGEDPENHLRAIEPIVKQLQESAAILAEEYRKYAVAEQKPGAAERTKIETALRKMYVTLEQCKKAVDLELKKTKKGD